jgi:hypothetical protein
MYQVTCTFQRVSWREGGVEDICVSNIEAAFSADLGSSSE